MKKYLVLILVVLFSISVIADVNSRSVEKVVPIQGKTKQQIFTKSIEWFMRSFVDGKSVIQLQDSVNGKIIGKGFNASLYRCCGMYSIQCSYTMIIDIKDNKIRVTFTDPIIKGDWRNSDSEFDITFPEGCMLKNNFSEFESYANDRTESLVSYIQTESGKENW